MANTKQTSPRIAKLASKVLRNPKSGKDIKKLAGSALSQTKTPNKRGK